MALTGYPGEHTYELWEGVGQMQSTIGAFFNIQELILNSITRFHLLLQKL